MLLNAREAGPNRSAQLGAMRSAKKSYCLKTENTHRNKELVAVMNELASVYRHCLQQLYKGLDGYGRYTMRAFHEGVAECKSTSWRVHASIHADVSKIHHPDQRRAELWMEDARSFHSSPT